MGLFDGMTDPNSGLMGMFANPQTAGLLGLGQGLLQASGPSRIPVSMGQALGNGLGQMQQGIGNAFQTQQQLLRMRAMQGLMGGIGGAQPQSQQADPTLAQGTPVYGAANSGPMSGLSAGLGAAAPQMPSPQAGGAAPTAGIYGRSPQELFQQGMLMNMAGIQGGGDMMRIAVEHDPTLARMMPTDIQKNAAAAYGFGSPEYTNAIRGVVDKEGIVALRPGAPYIRGGQVYGTPGQAPAGYMNVPNGDGTWTVQPVAGGPEAVKGSAAAGAIGKAYGTNTTGYQNGQPVYVNQGQLSDQLTSGGPGAGVAGFTPFQNAIRQVESGGNPMAINPASGASGSMQTMGPTLTNPGFGVTPARDNSPAEKQRVGADYAAAMQQRYGNDTDAAVAYNWGPQNADKWIAAGRPWKMLPRETQGYVGQVHAQMQNFSGGQQGGLASGVAPELPPGSATAANASQGAPGKQMADAYGSLSNADANYQQSREALQQMLALAHNQGLGGTVARMLPADVATRISNDAAEYQKAHANYVSLQGKALGSGGTDASRATLNEAVPTYDKPQDAKIAGLTNQLNQLDQMHMKTQFLTPLYSQGNEKTFTTQSAAFDQNIKPSMMPILQMSGDQQRAAVQAAIKANPRLRANFEWAFNNGMLK
ncbi:transglycosylase SLT domain-containing protein [Burkholderia sp. GbtcB21]|uniref:transglycosylase SLT domain-containing protein n=1 Tax=Burkholderia sp. GbtcB21 TaxID=2824766 RepID=UPI001C3009CA|nr:transglycosylase SLT domain-containing protein [Burkholderia sp. GbtcB21]